MYDNKDVTVIILTHGRYGFLKKLFESMSKLHKLPAHVIVVDSLPEEKINIKKLTKKVKTKIDYYKIDEKKFTEGYARMTHMRNLFLPKSKTKITSFIDDDVYLKPYWLDGVLDGFNKFPEAAGITGPTIDADLNLKPLKKVVRDNKNRNYVNMFGMVSDSSPYQVNSKPFKCYLMKGANMNFKTEVIKKHGFDSTYAGNCLREDSDASMRIVRDGHHFIYHPKAYLYHMKAPLTGTRKYGDAVYFYEAGINHKYFCDKYFNKFLTRLSWIFFCKFPPSLLLSIPALIFKKKNTFHAHRALWFGSYPKKPRTPAKYIKSHIQIHN